MDAPHAFVIIESVVGRPTKKGMVSTNGNIMGFVTTDVFTTMNNTVITWSIIRGSTTQKLGTIREFREPLVRTLDGTNTTWDMLDIVRGST